MNTQSEILEKFININVGGEYFTTTRETLLKIPNTMLAAMFSGAFKVEKIDGRYFIDRDGQYFKYVSIPKTFISFFLSIILQYYILNFLREGEVDLPG